MYARVARWENADPDALRAGAERINASAADGPPEGVPAKSFRMLIDPENGRSISIVMFETEEDLQQGHETLNNMNPPDDSGGSRTSVELYEVAVDVTAP
jgi:hypothetical protein